MLPHPASTLVFNVDKSAAHIVTKTFQVWEDVNTGAHRGKVVPSESDEVNFKSAYVSYDAGLNLWVCDKILADLREYKLSTLNIVQADCRTHCGLDVVEELLYSIRKGKI
jgi:hypothetical protein